MHSRVLVIRNRDVLDGLEQAELMIERAVEACVKPVTRGLFGRA